MNQVVAALKLCLEMSEYEKSERNRRNLEFSTKLTTNNWAIQVLQDIISVEKNTSVGQENFAVGFGMGFRVMGVKAGFHELDVTALTKAYRSSKCRLIILDWGGTLVAETSKSDSLQAYAVATGNASHTAPTAELKSTLETLCADARNVVFVVSGRELYAVSDFFGDVPGLGLGAEHGFYYRWPQEEYIDNLVRGSSGSKSRWQTIHSQGDQKWKEATKIIMDIYVQHTQGTYIEQKGSALIWQFRDADPEFGYMQSKELEEHLKMVLLNHSVDVIRGGGVADGYIEVRPAGVSKGLFLQHAIATLKSQNRSVDFILAVGDDVSDEPMFEQIARIKSESSLDNLFAFSVTVGKKPTSAESYVDDPKSVIELLTVLNKVSQRENRYFSTADLANMTSLKAPLNLSSPLSLSVNFEILFD
jgi:trehalose 6-phosphate synthase/phosphatase